MWGKASAIVRHHWSPAIYQADREHCSVYKEGLFPDAHWRCDLDDSEKGRLSLQVKPGTDENKRGRHSFQTVKSRPRHGIKDPSEYLLCSFRNA